MLYFNQILLQLKKVQYEKSSIFSKTKLSDINVANTKLLRILHQLCLEHCLRTYYVLTRYFYNENKVLYKESIIFSKTKVLKR